MKHTTLALLGLALASAACGGSKPPPDTSAKPNPTPTTSASAAASATAAAPVTSASAAPVASASAKPADDDTHDDPNESAEHLTMTPLIAKGAKVTYPKKTVDDGACWKTVGLTGKHDKDFDALVEKCGTPTGLVEYAKPVHGRLHHKHDKRDTFTMKLAGGMCYRYFTVADGTITDIDILVLKPNGAMVADDKTSHPVAIIDPAQPWCIDKDAEYVFAIEVDGPGKGGYTFGVWARPK
ncbi:MAG: hypothetical protein JNL38_18515 [Myxococcales bacterium]|nr:hypothetical protein [Myxococcales bacterium]